MDQRELEILIAHQRVRVPRAGRTPLDRATLATLAANLTHYGYALTHDGFAALAAASEEDARAWWLAMEGALIASVGDGEKMAEHVVYKNFPNEVLAMDESEYWLRQILMYWGLPNELVTPPSAPRPALNEEVSLEVLQVAEDDALGEIYAAHLRRPVRWTDAQWEEVRFLAPRLHALVPVASVPFKENLVRLAALLVELGVEVRLSTATDVLRLAVAMSGGDVALREPAKLRTFTRKERRALLAMLEAAPQLEEDAARRRERFKRLLRALRPGDYATRAPRVVALYDTLYRGAPIETFNTRLERLLAARDPAALALLAERPGELLRRLHHALLLFGADAAGAFVRVLPKLTTGQLLKVLKHLETTPARAYRAFPPKGNWNKLQVRPADPERRLPPKVRRAVTQAIEHAIAERVTRVVPSVRLDPRTRWITLQTNDSDLTPYGRGTVFPIPDEVTFIRTASYWESGPTAGNLWYDNGWNFFDAGWRPRGACCWNAVKYDDGAVFSGDPTNAKDLEGRACQLIDLYLDRLSALGVRFAVWNVLCYSNRTFDQAREVFAALEWGKQPASGTLFEPSRCQLSFPLRGANLTKYIAYIDLDRRQMVYVDANLPGRVSSAAGNQKILEALMPAFLEHVAALPTVHDLFRGVPTREDGMCVAYDDADRTLRGGPAYVFAPTNPASAFSPFDLGTLLR